MAITDHQLPVIRTTDMAMAAYLRINGARHLTMELIEFPDEDRQDQVEWVYQGTPRVNNLVSDYNEGSATVEPKKFATILAIVRRELYAFINLDAPAIDG
jgi:hypothetical protein